MPCEPLIDAAARHLGPLVSDRDRFPLFIGRDQDSCSGALVRLESEEFVVEIIRDRGAEWITVGTKIRAGPRKPLRWWPLGHLVAYLDGAPEPYPLSDLETEAGWLIQREDEILDSRLINSDDLNRWAADASRRIFGQATRKRPASQ